MNDNNDFVNNNNEKNNEGFFKILKDLATIGSSHFVAAIISGGFWLYMATLLETSEYGIVGYLIAASTIAFRISNLGATNTVMVYTAKEKKSQSTLFLISLILSAVVSLIIFFVFYNIGASLFVIGSVIFALSTSDLLGRNLYKDFLKYIITQRILLVIFALGLYYVLGTDGIVLGFALSYFPFFLRLQKSFKEIKISVEELKEKYKFVFHSYSLELSRALMHNLDIIIIMPLFGFTVLGNYTLGVQFLFFIAILPTTVYQYVLPRYATGKSNSKIISVTIVISIIIALLGYIFAPIIIPELFPKFFEAVQIIQIMSFAIIPLSINRMIISEFLGTDKSRIVLEGSILYVAVQISGIIILGEIYGIYGAASSIILASSAETIFFLTRKILEKSRT